MTKKQLLEFIIFILLTLKISAIYKYRKLLVRKSVVKELCYNAGKGLLGHVAVIIVNIKYVIVVTGKLVIGVVGPVPGHTFRCQPVSYTIIRKRFIIKIRIINIGQAIQLIIIGMGDVRAECALPMQALHERPPFQNVVISD